MNGPSHLEKCCPEEETELRFDYDCSLDFMQDVTLPQAQGDVENSVPVVTLDGGLNLLDQVMASTSSLPSPISDSSSDSGILPGGSADEDVFLAGLFGSDFSLIQNTPLDMYSPSPSPTGQSVASPAEPEPQPEPVHSKSGKTAASSSDSVTEKNRKNAEAARQNRIKKKKYVEDLEKERASLKRDNVVLKTKCHEFQTRCQRLQSEVNYLKSVLANDSVLASLIQNIPNVPGVNLSSSFRKRPSPDNDSGLEGVKRKKSGTGGICLHVSKDILSLEFCENCSKQASS